MWRPRLSYRLSWCVLSGPCFLSDNETLNDNDNDNENGVLLKEKRNLPLGQSGKRGRDLTALQQLEENIIS